MRSPARISSRSLQFRNRVDPGPRNPLPHIPGVDQSAALWRQPVVAVYCTEAGKKPGHEDVELSLGGPFTSLSPLRREDMTARSSADIQGRARLYFADIPQIQGNSSGALISQAANSTRFCLIAARWVYPLGRPSNPADMFTLTATSIFHSTAVSLFFSGPAGRLM